MSTPGPHSRVLVADELSASAIERLRSMQGVEVDVALGMKPAELAARIGDYDALLVRSATQVTAEALKSPGRLRVIGRAGTGVDNIDLEAATRAGVVVLNTPGGNSVAAAELTLSLLLALARHIAQANQDLRAGRWERKKYMGVEVAGKTLGLIGLGRIGREVARRAQALRMEVIAYDPFVSAQSSEGGMRLVTLDEVIAGADFISLHVPLSTETRHMIDAEAMQKMKRGTRLINCARGGLIDEAALLAALESGQVAGAALDVFETEPPQDRRLVEHPRVVSTPHLGASTLEAQERVGTEIVEKVLDYLRGGVILDAVNFPSVGREGYATLGPVMGLAERLGSFLGQVAEGRMRRLEVRCLGSFAAQPLRPVVMAAVRGLLAPVLEGGVSYVNALTLAAERGLTVEETRSAEDAAPYAGLLRLTLQTDEGEASVAGTLFAPDRPRLVEVDRVSIESHPAGHMLFVRNRDVPGVVGRIGTILGCNAVNIAGIQLGRAKAGAMAVSIIDVDSAVPGEALTEIRQIAEIVFVRAIAV